MASGLPKSYINKYGISKKAWKEYRKSKKRTTSRSRNPRRKGVRRLARRRYTRRRRRRAKKTIPILPIVGVGAAIYEPVKRAVSGDIEGGLKELVQRSTGINLDDPTGAWHPEWLSSFWLPIIATAIGHKVANMVGINRMMAKLPSPLNKLRL